MNYDDITKLDNKDLVKGIYDFYGQRVSDSMLAELMRREMESIEKLDSSIKGLDNATSLYSRWLIALAVIIAILIFVMTIKMFIP